MRTPDPAGKTGTNITRRSVLAGMGSLALGELVSARSLAQIRPKQPNIFMVLVDDVIKRDQGCYGNRLVRTPRLDQLASEGMRFDNFYCTSPSCCPSRASLFTGLYPFRNGAHANWSEVKPGIKSMAHYMNALGYRTVLLDKAGLVGGVRKDFPFEYYGRDRSWESLQEILANPGDKPYCIIEANFGTHDPWLTNKFKYDPAQVGIPPDVLDTPEARKIRANYYSAITEMDETIGRVLDLLKQTRQEQNTLFIWTVDHGTDWPRGKRNLYESGINIPFIARWPGQIRPGTVCDALISAVDIVPTFIEIAGGNVSDVVSKVGAEPLDGSSFLPVLLGEKKEHRSEIYASHSWDVVEAYPHRAVRTSTHKYIWNIDSRFTYPTGWAILSPVDDFPTFAPAWKSWEELAKTDSVAAEWIQNLLHRPPEELYDLRSDPYELKNLAKDPGRAELLASMREKLKHWMQQQGDAGDSAYWMDEVNPWRKPFLQELYSRQVAVSINVVSFDSVNSTVQVELACPIWQGTEIRYTLDGTEPTRNSPLYAEQILLSPPAVIKAKAFFEKGETPVQEFRHDAVDYRFLYEHTHYVPLIKNQATVDWGQRNLYIPWRFA